MQFRSHTSVLGWLYLRLLHAKLFRSTAHFYKEEIEQLVLRNVKT